MTDQRLTKTYADRSYVFTTMVRHNGTVVAFAMDEWRVIYYSVLALDTPDATRGELDVNFWSDEPVVLRFPSELAEVGFAAAGATPMPAVKKGSREETSLALEPEELDPFLSTTARLTAGSTPFQVLSDGKHIFLFRESVREVHPDAVFKLNGGGSSGDRSREDYVRAEDGTKVPLTRESVLCDRFVLAGSELKPCMEVRYRRSRHKTLPDSQTDTLGTEDMDGKPFYEPTQELSFIRDVQHGRFAVVLLPTQVAELKRWQFFVANARTKRIDAFNLEQGEDGLFNTQGSLLYTSPDPAYQSAVLERAPGLCPFTGLELVPLLPERDFAETALAFDGKDDQVEVTQAAKLAFEGRAYTLEAWVMPKALGKSKPMSLIRKLSSATSLTGSYDLSILKDGKLRLSHEVSGAVATSTGAVTAGKYHHVAVTYDGTTARFYLDGAAVGSKEMDFTSNVDQPLVIGASLVKSVVADPFEGVIDEVRFWERARDAAELSRDKGFRLVGNEPGLVAYYRFDEGEGSTLNDQTDNVLRGALKGSPTWVTSEAPVGERPSLRRDSFVLNGRTVASSMAALLYHQQERTGSGASRSLEAQKRQARVMLAFATSGKGPQGKATRDTYAAVLDFAVAGDGRLAQMKDVATLPWLRPPAAEASSDAVSKAKAAVKDAEKRVEEAQAQVAAVKDELTSLGKQGAGNGSLLTLHWFAISFLTPYYFLGVRDAKEGSAVTVFPPAYGKSPGYQQWRFIPSDKGGYLLQNRQSKMYLELGTSGLVQRATSTGWTWTPSVSSYSYSYLVVAHTDTGHTADVGKVLAVANKDTGALHLTSNRQDSTAILRRLVEGEPCEDLEALRRKKTKELAALRLELTAAQQDLASKSAALALLTLGEQGGEVSLPMDLLSIDRRGLPVTGALLGFAMTKHVPFLVDSTTGQVILYFRGLDDGGFLAAYYEPSVSREVLQLGDATEGLTLVASSAGVDLGDLEATVAPGSSGDRCKLTLEALGFKEEWLDVPRAPRLLADVLAGQARPEFLGTVASVSGKTLKLKGGAQRSLAAGDRIEVGGEVLQVSKASKAKVTQLTLEAAPTGTLKAGQAIRYLPYDYRQATSTRPGSTLARGSLWLRPVPTLSVEPLADGVAEQVLSTTLGRWHGDAPGRDLYFDGTQSLASQAGLDTTPLAVTGDVTLEAWLRPESVSASSVVLACAPSARTAESSNLALKLDGGTYVRFGDEVALAGLDFTLELRLKRTALDKAEVLLAHGLKGAAANKKLVIAFDAKGQLSLDFGKEKLVDPEAVKDTKWHHYAFTHDASGFEVVMYRDGKEVARKTREAAYEGEDELFLGAQVLDDGSPTTPSTCSLDEVRVWDHVRTLQAIESGQDVRMAGDTAGLLACWHFTPEEVRDSASADGALGGTYVGTPAFEESPLSPLTNPQAPLEYVLALVPEKTVHSALALDGDTQVRCGDTLKLAKEDFTVELWLRRTKDKVPGRVLFHGSTRADESTRLSLDLTAENTLTLSVGSGATDVQTSLSDTAWHHYAFTHSAQSRTVVLYRDGAKVGSKTLSQAYAGEGEWSLGGLALEGEGTSLPLPATCEVDEVRVWSEVRSTSNLTAFMKKRMLGTEKKLQACWSFNDSRVRDSTGRQFHCTVIGTPGFVTSPIDSGFKVLAGIGDSYFLSRESFPEGSWRHVAFAFQQSWGMRLRAGAWLEVAHANAFQLTGDLTLEAFLTVDAMGRHQPLFCKGSFADGSGQQVPYRFSISENGRLVFAFETKGSPPGNRKEYFSTGTVTAGVFHRVAVVRKAGTSRTEKKVQKTIDGQTIDVVESVEVKEWNDIRFYIDGADAGGVRYEDAAPLGHEGPLFIGRMTEGTDTFSLAGTLAELRVWNRALDPAQLGIALNPRDSGLVARWRFPEDEGNVTQDDSQSYPARLHDAARVKSPNPAGSPAWLYVSGQGVALEPLSASHTLVQGLPRQGAGLSLGGLSGGKKLSGAFQGELEEVRIWNTLRGEEQVLDNLFTRLKGEKADLIAYYTFDLDSTRPESTRVNDNGLRGNHLELPARNRPSPRLSTAPVSNDTARVCSALAGVRTPFHAPINNGPAVAEYGDLQRDAKGGLRGTMKRAYGFIQDGAWSLVTGYKVGNLVTEWVSQGQFAPQVIGFIEGAPPVPSENLTAGAIEFVGEVPRDLSRVELVQAEQVTTTLSDSSQGSRQGSFAVTRSLLVNEDVEIVTAPLGVGTSVPVVKVEGTGSVGTRAELSGGWVNDDSQSTTRLTSRNMAVSLTGNWEDPKKPRAEGMERRIVPANVGFALVQSETADVYSMRLEHNRALVGYRMVPNPDIPKDWNLLSFPINPLYTKQGTLDGCIGFSDTGKILDPDYSKLTPGSELSYFKPREAYDLKRRIRQEEQRELGYFRSFSPGASLIPSVVNGVVQAASTMLQAAIGVSGIPAPQVAGEAVEAAAGAFAKRNMCNTYVWTARGGTFAETTETTDVVTESQQGSFTYNSSTEGSVGLNLEIFGVGMGLQLDVSMGGGQGITRAKSSESSRGFSLELGLDLPNNIQKYKDGEPVFDSNNQPVLVPGKVDAYRFMSFYLDTDRRNFDDLYRKVIDPIWLEESSEANALALRQARQPEKAPPCWRILHRVTFVSRLLPPVPPKGAPPLETAMRAENVSSNYELIQRLEPYVREHLSSQERLAEATRQALTSYLPELLPHATQVIQYLAQYYEVPG